MTIFAVSDLVWQAVIAGAVTVTLAWMSQRTKKAVETTGTNAEATGKVTAGKVEEVKDTLKDTTATTDKKLDSIAATGERTHTLVNSNMGVQLKLNAAVTRRLADLTNDPADIEAAVLAEKLLREHEGKQAVVDAKDAKN